MAKTIALNYEGKDYVLEFTRASVERMERRGFTVTELTEKPVTVLPELFAGAFYANHPQLKRDVINKIFDKIGDKETFIIKLSEMYTEPIETLMEEPEDEGKLEWKASW